MYTPWLPQPVAVPTRRYTRRTAFTWDIPGRISTDGEDLEVIDPVPEHDETTHTLSVLEFTDLGQPVTPSDVATKKDVPSDPVQCPYTLAHMYPSVWATTPFPA